MFCSFPLSSAWCISSALQCSEFLLISGKSPCSSNWAKFWTIMFNDMPNTFFQISVNDSLKWVNVLIINSMTFMMILWMMTMLMVKWWWRQGLTRNETILPIHVWGQYPGESWWERAKRVESESLCDGNQDVWDVFLKNMRLPPPWTRRSKGEKVGRRKMRNKNFGMLSRKRSSLNKKWVKIRER